MDEPHSPRPPLPPPDVRRALPPDGGHGFNRLIHESSPYLLQHARNPVAWFPWGDEAFEKARREDKPVFLSVGYSACHWCHVMERESFEHAAIAAVLNEAFVPVKVDREELPEVDHLYLLATQLMTGQGGWPNSVWLMPDKRPWFAGTYFPPDDRGGRPGFRTLLRQLADLWAHDRDRVMAQAEAVTDAIRRHVDAPAAAGDAPTRIDLDAVVAGAVDALAAAYDPAAGGFGGAPKFPPHTALRFLMHPRIFNTHPDARAMVCGTLDAMQAGGICDHVGGGFHRYSTDAQWLVPHFEKMLYDNALLARAYAEAFRLTAVPSYAETACATLDWMIREMCAPGGAFHASLDADSGGEEGRFYTWTSQEVEAALGVDAAASFLSTYNCTPDGNFRDESSGRRSGANIPHRSREQASHEAAEPRMREMISRLRVVRAERVRPALDTKVIAGWNGLAIAALATAGRLLGEPRYVAAAVRAAEFVLAPLRSGARLYRIFADDRWSTPAHLDDHAAVADGLLDLYEATGEDRWRDEAIRLAREMNLRFRGAPGEPLFLSPDDGPALIARPRPLLDEAAPSGNGLASRVFLRFASLTSARSWLEQGADIVRAATMWCERAPEAAGTLLEAAAIYLDACPPGAFLRDAPVTLAAAGFAQGEPFGWRVHLCLDEGWHIEPVSDADEEPGATLVKVGRGTVKAPDPVALPPAVGGGRGLVGEVVFVVRSDAAAAGEDVEFVLTAQPCGPSGCLGRREYRLHLSAASGIRAV